MRGIPGRGRGDYSAPDPGRQAADRRGLLRKAQRFAKAGLTTAGLLASLGPDFAAGQQVRPDDARLKTEWNTVPSPTGNGPGQDARGFPGVRRLAARPRRRQRQDGAVGFCYGGGMAHWLATRLPDLNAAVPFYGNSPAPEEAAKVKAPLLVHLAAVDERINAAWPAYEAALKAAGARYTVVRYPGTQHGFHNDTTPLNVSRPRASAAASARGASSLRPAGCGPAGRRR